jgi:hypothetical protein
VTIVRIARTRLLGARWPRNFPMSEAAPAPRMAATDAAFSTNEG